jgi:hypothetical protein
MRQHFCVIAFCILGLMACRKSPQDIAIQRAEEQIKAGLRDPDSAQFSNERAHEDQRFGMVVCGLLNAKNSFGGYVGRRRFYAWVYTASVIVNVDDETDKYANESFDKFWKDIGCG